MQDFFKRLHEKTNVQMLHFHSSISFDQRLAKEDIEGSIAHVAGLVKHNILSQKEGESIKQTLLSLLEEIEEGEFSFSEEFEDIHMNIEKELTKRMGDLGKKLHTGRSRNDQVALDMKLFVRKELEVTTSLLENLLHTLMKLAEKHLESYMPAFTHMQKAQVTTFAHHVMAYVEMFHRDICRLQNTKQLLNFCPLGAAALTGTTYPLDRNYTSVILGFEAPTRNSLDSVSDRDYIIDSLHDFSMILLHLSRFCEEIVFFSSQDYAYLEVSDGFATGSSIMPQKKNPDAAELIRGKSGRVFGHLLAMLTTMKGLPLAYNKDLQEDKEAFFDALDTTKACISVFTGMIANIEVKAKRMEEACYTGYMEATDIADYLSRKGMPFRDAYALVGQMVQDAIANKTIFKDWSLESFQQYSKLFQGDIFGNISLKTMVESRITLGSPRKENVQQHIKEMRNMYRE